MAIVVTTPTGQIGSRVVERLLAAGAEVAVLARHPEKLAASVRERVRVRRGSQDDPAAVIAATEGAEALFWLTPPDPTAPDVFAHSARFSAAAVAAIAANAIPRVVHLSSAGAQNAEGLGLVNGTHRDERALDGTSASVLHLRPGFFFENFLQQADAIRRDGAVYVPSPGTTKLPMVATRDIGDAAAAKLLDPSWSGRPALGLHGPADLTWREATEVLARAIGKPLRYVEITPDQFRQVASSFASPSWIAGYLEMLAGFSAPGVIAEPRTAETTTPTTLDAWAREILAPLVSA